jgi:hypothetical protein
MKMEIRGLRKKKQYVNICMDKFVYVLDFNYLIEYSEHDFVCCSVAMFGPQKDIKRIYKDIDEDDNWEELKDIVLKIENGEDTPFYYA